MWACSALVETSRDTIQTHKYDVSADLFAAQKSGNAYNTNSEPDVEITASGGLKNAYAEASQSSSFSRHPVQARLVTLSPTQTENQSSDQVPLSAQIALSENIPLVQAAYAEKEQSVRSQKPSGGRDYSTTPNRCMTVSDVAAYLKVSVSTVWRLLNKDPRFPKPRRIGGSGDGIGVKSTLFSMMIFGLASAALENVETV